MGLFLSARYPCIECFVRQCEPPVCPANALPPFFTAATNRSFSSFDLIRESTAGAQFVPVQELLLHAFEHLKIHRGGFSCVHSVPLFFTPASWRISRGPRDSSRPPPPPHPLPSPTRSPLQDHPVLEALGFRVQGSGCRVHGSGFTVHGAGFRASRLPSSSPASPSPVSNWNSSSAPQWDVGVRG